MILERCDNERYLADRRALLRLAEERYDACMAAVEQARTDGIAARISIPEGSPATTKQISIGPGHVILALRVRFALLCDLQDATGADRIANIPLVEQGRFQLL